MNPSSASTNVESKTKKIWAKWFGRTVGLGIVINMLFFIPCFFFFGVVSAIFLFLAFGTEQARGSNA